MLIMWTLSVCPPLFLSVPLFPFFQHSLSNTDICSERDACMSVSHSFPWSLVLFWLCSCFPLRSGTPDDGRPRYELHSFFPVIPPLSLLLPLCSTMCVSNSCAMLRLEASEMGCHLTAFEWPSWVLVSQWFFFCMTPFQAHLVFYSPICWVAVSFISTFSCLLIIHIYCTFWCFMMCTSSKGIFAVKLLGSNAWWWKIAYWIFKLILISPHCCNACYTVCPFYLHLSVFVATAYSYHAAEQICHVLFFLSTFH